MTTSRRKFFTVDLLPNHATFDAADLHDDDNREVERNNTAAVQGLLSETTKVCQRAMADRNLTPEGRRNAILAIVQGAWKRGDAHVAKTEGSNAPTAADQIDQMISGLRKTLFDPQVRYGRDADGAIDPIVAEQIRDDLLNPKQPERKPGEPPIAVELIRRNRYEQALDARDGLTIKLIEEFARRDPRFLKDPMGKDQDEVLADGARRYARATNPEKLAKLESLELREQHGRSLRHAYVGALGRLLKSTALRSGALRDEHLAGIVQGEVDERGMPAAGEE